MAWSPEQDDALRQIGHWHRYGDSQVFRLFGYAGTGKTTLAKHIANGVRGLVCFAAFTGKAALMLKKKGCPNASTIHSLIYKVREVEEKDDQGNVVGTKLRYGLNPLATAAEASLIIVDECSMVDERLGRDLLSFGRPILVLGDPAQLPPVRGEGFFTTARPDVLLTEIHRQARDNPIIRLSMDVREGRALQPGSYGESRVLRQGKITEGEVLAADQVLCGMNKTRATINRKVRRLRGRDLDYPEAGDKLVCLKNDKDKGLLNGSLWGIGEVKGFDQQGAMLAVNSEDGLEPAEVYVRREFFEGTEKEIPPLERKYTDEFAYGYGLTVHKSQGSQWGNVVIFDESFAFRQDRTKHLYTAITRAAERVTVVA